jgi:penicillin-binding protein 1C
MIEIIFATIGTLNQVFIYLKVGFRRLFPTNKRFRRVLFLIFGIWYLFFALPEPIFTDPVSVVLEDRNEELLGARIAKDGQWRFPNLDTIPENFAQSLVEFEDKRFYYHPGIDPIGIGRAIIQNIKNKSVVSGGSTLSTQIIRMARKGKPRTIREKLIEFVLATRLELRYSKREILAMYASNAPFGGNVVGINAASWRYFGKSPNLLSWGESATLAVLPNAPALIHPGRNRDALYAKRNRLLYRLLDKGVIDSLTCNLAEIEPLPDEPLPLPRFAPHLLERAKLEVFKQNPKKARIQSTIDKELQKFTTDIVNKHHALLSANSINNLSAMIMDVETGNVLSYVGNVYEQETNEHGHEVDIITAPRSSGSILKPFLYAMMINEGKLLPTNTLPDIPTQMKNYRPQNFYETYDGTVPAQRALARSLNVPAVRMLQDYGLEKFHFNLKKIGLTTINKSPDYYGLPLILGGAEVKLWDLMGAYSSMARTLLHYQKYDGRYNPKDFRLPNYLKTVASPTPSNQDLLKEPPVFSAAAISKTFEAMLEVERPTADGAWEIFESRRMIAWKTGTSFGFRDAWAVGVSPKYVVGVWAGNADGEGRPGLVGVQAAAPVLFDIFNNMGQFGWFNKPIDELVETKVCTQSGYLPTDYCEETEMVSIPKVGLNSGSCPYHKTIHLDKTSKFRVHSDCESPSKMQHISWFVLPPVEEFYYKNNHPNYKLLPPYREDCLASLPDREQPMELIYPKRIAQIYVPIDLDGKLSPTVFKVAHRQPETPIYWHLDNEYLGSTTTFHDFALNPAKGKHTLTLVDKDGHRLETEFEIIGKE